MEGGHAVRRHQFASIQLDLGVELTVVSKMMGHANRAITGDLYSHLLESKARHQAEATSAWLQPVQAPAASL